MCPPRALLHIIAKMYPTLPTLIDRLGTAYGVTLVEPRKQREKCAALLKPDEKAKYRPAACSVLWLPAS